MITFMLKKFLQILTSFIWIASSKAQNEQTPMIVPVILCHNNNQTQKDQDLFDGVINAFHEAFTDYRGKCNECLKVNYWLENWKIFSAGAPPLKIIEGKFFESVTKDTAYRHIDLRNCLFAIVALEKIQNMIYQVDFAIYRPSDGQRYELGKLKFISHAKKDSLLNRCLRLRADFLATFFENKKLYNILKFEWDDVKAKPLSDDEFQLSTYNYNLIKAFIAEEEKIGIAVKSNPKFEIIIAKIDQKDNIIFFMYLKLKLAFYLEIYKKGDSKRIAKIKLREIKNLGIDFNKYIYSDLFLYLEQHPEDDNVKQLLLELGVTKK
jgi:hypothetical protein